MKSKIDFNFLFLLTVGFFATYVVAEPLEDEVLDLPGLPYPPPFRQFSGYLDALEGRKLHYWFTECETNPETAPVLLWLNGGPGCSSDDGLLSGNGPFHVNSDGKTLFYNIYSWNKVANVIYLEAPAGVGYSYSTANNNTRNFTTDDDQTAADNYEALHQFFIKFPEYATNDFYITGESYAGIYIPTLTTLVLNGSYTFNLKGIAVGNGVNNKELNVNSVVLFAATHGLIGRTVFRGLVNACCDGAPPEQCQFYQLDNLDCLNSVLGAVVKVLESRVNVYGIYNDCETPYFGNITTNSQVSPDFSHWMGALPNVLQKKLKNLDEVLPCQSSAKETAWMNQPEVRAALHIPDFVQNWVDCSSAVADNYHQIYSTMEPQYRYILTHVPALLYHGDTDCVCNFIGGEWFANSFGLEVENDYRPWKYQNQTAGFVENFTNLTYATVLGSGHMVPTDKPGPALELISTFISKTRSN